MDPAMFVTIALCAALILKISASVFGTPLISVSLTRVNAKCSVIRRGCVTSSPWRSRSRSSSSVSLETNLFKVLRMNCSCVSLPLKKSLMHIYFASVAGLSSRLQGNRAGCGSPSCRFGLFSRMGHACNLPRMIEIALSVSNTIFDLCNNCALSRSARDVPLWIFPLVSMLTILTMRPIRFIASPPALIKIPTQPALARPRCFRGMCQ